MVIINRPRGTVLMVEFYLRANFCSLRTQCEELGKLDLQNDIDPINLGAQGEVFPTNINGCPFLFFLA